MESRKLEVGDSNLGVLETIKFTYKYKYMSPQCILGTVSLRLCHLLKLKGVFRVFYRCQYVGLLVQFYLDLSIILSNLSFQYLLQVLQIYLSII